MVAPSLPQATGLQWVHIHPGHRPIMVGSMHGQRQVDPRKARKMSWEQSLFGSCLCKSGPSGHSDVISFLAATAPA